MVNWIGNEVDQWYIDGLFLYILMGNRLSINLVTSRRGLQVVYSQMNWKKPRRLRLFEDETAEFLLFAERKNICLYPETCREIGEKIEESLRGGKIVKSFQIFWMHNYWIWFSYDVKNYAFASVDNSLFDKRCIIIHFVLSLIQYRALDSRTKTTTSTRFSQYCQY